MHATGALTLRGKGQKLITIVTAYNATYTTGDTTNVWQQLRVLTHLHVRHIQHINANPRHQFILDLQAWLEHRIHLGQDIILCMDANGTYDLDNSVSSHSLKYVEGVPTIDHKHDGKLSTLISTCHLLDPLAHHHSTRPFPASHIRESQQIDFILTTPNIFPTAIASGSMSQHFLFRSDHRTYYVDFSAEALFSDTAYEIQPAIHRRLRLNDPRLIQQYQSLLHEHLQLHKVLESK
jgi:hypothetical protein